MNIKSAHQASSGSQRKRKSSDPHHNPKDAKTFKPSFSETIDVPDHDCKEEVENLQTNVLNCESTLNTENCKKTMQAFFKTSNKNCSEESVRVRQALSEPNNIEVVTKKTVINNIKQEHSEDLEVIEIVENGDISSVESETQKIRVDNKEEMHSAERSPNIKSDCTDDENLEVIAIVENGDIISVESKTQKIRVDNKEEMHSAESSPNIKSDCTDDDSITLSTDELDSSVLNSSTQSASTSMKMSCDSSEDNKNKIMKVIAHMIHKIDETKDFTSEKLTSIEDKSPKEVSNLQNTTRKRKRMSLEGAKIKTLQRMQTQNEKELKKIQRLKDLEAKKEARLKEAEEKRLKKEEKLKEKMEMKDRLLKEKQKRKEKEEQEKKEKLRLKMEKKDQEEKERLQKLQQKEEKNKLKQQLLEAKAEEKKKKEEERQKYVEEKKKAEKEEEKKREKTKNAFVNFFVKTKTSELPQVNEPGGAFRPFQVTNHMVLAPVVPEVAQARFDRKLLEQSLLTQDYLMLYLEELKQGKHHSFKHKKNKKKVEDDDSVIILDFEDKEVQTESFNLHPKLLQFCENVRPPYWGTWRKKSKVIHPRNPFGREELFDYDIDSDDEWDEGGPGESLSGTEDEESEDDYEVDNEFFVPHGYLSADEEKDEDNAVDSPELHHARLKAKEYEFEAERCKKTIELKPCVIGCFWEINTILGNQQLQRALKIYSAEIMIKRPIETSFSLAKAKADENTSILLSPESGSPSGENSSQKRLATPKQPVPEEAMPYLIQLVHANTNGRPRVIKEFQEFWLLQHNKKDNINSCKETLNNSFASPTSSRTGNKVHIPEKCENTTPKMSDIQSGKISKRQLEITMQKICIWCKCPSSVISRFCWWVHDDVRQKYGLTELPVPNKWQYVSCKEVGNSQLVSQPVANIGTPSIKNFLHL